MSKSPSEAPIAWGGSTRTILSCRSYALPGVLWIIAKELVRHPRGPADAREVGRRLRRLVARSAPTPERWQRHGRQRI